MGLEDCKIINLARINEPDEPRGNLTFIEGGHGRHVPFEIKRVYYIYDVPDGVKRAGHGHRTLEQVIIAMSGSFDVTLDDGRKQERFHLDRPDSVLYVAPMMWREIENFSSGSVCMVLASHYYDVADYFRNYENFLRAVGENG